mgnify:CR=1 FL=1
MKELYQIMEKMTKEGIYFSYQSQSTSEYFNLAVKNPNTNNEEYYHAGSLEQMNKHFIDMWDNIESGRNDKVFKPTIRKKIKELPKFPVPSGFPQMN